MSSSSRSTSVATIAGITVLGGLIAYAAYFDYKRRNDAGFRRRLRKDKKRADKTLAESLPPPITREVILEALERAKLEPAPASPELREPYFMDQISKGEKLSLLGPEVHLEAALCFYKGLQVYPSPMELIVIYQKTVPEPIFKLVTQMMDLDMTSKIEGYFHHFPPKSFNVAIETKASATMPGTRSMLVAQKDIKAGEVIYKESPIVATLDYDLHEAGTHCNHCLRVIVDREAAVTTSDNFKSVFCSSDCQIAAKMQYQNLLFSLEPPLPPQMSLPLPEEQKEQRQAAQEALVSHLAAHPERTGSSLIVAELVARQLALETEKMITAMMPGAAPKAPGGDFTDAEGGGYLLADHLERLRFLETEAPGEEVKLLSDVLAAALPGLEAFVTPERYATFLGKVAYNSFGVCYNGGRLDRPESYTLKTRTPFGTSHQVGSAFYTVSSYLSHSCTPNARPSFDGESAAEANPDGTTELATDGSAELKLVATRDITKGEELSVAFIDVAQPLDARRAELQAGWKFVCTCSKCKEEAEAAAGEGETVEVPAEDASKLEPTMKRFEKTTEEVPAA